MDLKVGDKVRIKSKEWFKNNILFSSVLSISDCYGKEATITKKMEYGYYINIGPKFMFWPETAFEPMEYWSVNMPKDTELKKTVTVNMPNDLDVSTVEYDGNITINVHHKEVEEPKFKNGDIIYSEIDDGYSYIAIYKDSGSDGSFIIYRVMISCDNYITFDGVCGADIFRLATKEEKEKLFKELANQKQLRWNAEEFKFEPISWRAEHGEMYWHITGLGTIISSIEYFDPMDNILYNLRNYFQTEELAKQALPKYKDFFKNLNIK
jgi:hypothetical protein